MCGRDFCDVNPSDIDCALEWEGDIDGDDDEDGFDVARRGPALVKRGKSRTYKVPWFDAIAGLVQVVILRSRGYPGPSAMYGAPRGPLPASWETAYRAGDASTGCRGLGSLNVASDLTNGGKTGDDRYSGWHEDHIVEVFHPVPMEDIVLL